MFTPSGKVLPRQLPISSHSAFFIKWGFITCNNLKHPFRHYC
jgi:hypothetical protein